MFNLLFICYVLIEIIQGDLVEILQLPTLLIYDFMLEAITQYSEISFPTKMHVIKFPPTLEAFWSG